MQSNGTGKSHTMSMRTKGDLRHGGKYSTTFPVFNLKMKDGMENFQELPSWMSVTCLKRISDTSS